MTTKRQTPLQAKQTSQAKHTITIITIYQLYYIFLNN
jgi:hypothetical protein